MAKYSEKGMYDKLSEFSNSRGKKNALKKYPDGGGSGKLSYTPYSLGFYSPVASNPVYNPSQMLTYSQPHLFSNPSQGSFRTPIELSIGMPYDRTQAGLTNPALSLSDPSRYSFNDYNYDLNSPNLDMSNTIYQEMADFLQKDVHELTESDLNKFAAAKELASIKPKYQTGLPIDAGLKYTVMGMPQSNNSPVRGMASIMGGYNPQSGFFGGADAGAYGLFGNVKPSTYLKRGLEDTGDFMFSPSLTLATGIRQRSGFLPDKELVDKYLSLLQDDIDAGTRTGADYYNDYLDSDTENINFAIKPELKFEYRPFEKIPMNLEAVLGANIDLAGKRQGQMDQLIPGVAPYGRASLVFPLGQVKKSVGNIDMPDINWPNLPQHEPRERRQPEPCPEGYRRYSPYGPCEPIEKVSHPRWLRDGGLAKFDDGGPGDKYYKYQNSQYKKDQQGNWYKWNGKSWNSAGYGNSAYDLGNHIGLEDWLKAGRMQDDNSNWSNDKPKSTVSNYEINRNNTLTNPLASTTHKIKITNAPLASNVPIQKDLYIQKEKEDKQKELEKQEELRQQHLRTVGSDNTIVDNSIITNNSLGNIPNMFEQMETLTKSQKSAANEIVNTGDFALHFPELYKEYLSKENSNREGGPLTMEEIALREIRTNPDFLNQLAVRKEKAWKKNEQRAYDELAWYHKGLNNATSFIADPLLTLNNAILRGERPLVGQGFWSIDPDDVSAEDNYYYDKYSGKSKSTLNNLFNYINIARAGAGAGESLADGEYGDALYNLATAIPMVKGAKYGWKGLNALMKTQPLKYVPGIAGTGWGGMTTGQALAGYGMYHAGTENLPNAYEAYSSGDWKKGNEELFMGLANSLPFVVEAKAGMPSVLQDISVAGNKIKQGYNTVAQGESVLPFAWKNPAANLDGAVSKSMFNKILQSDDFTPAEKAMLKEYQYHNSPFVRPGPKQDAFNELIGKANLTFPEETVVTRAFSSPERDFQAFTGTADDIKTISIQDRPSAFSAGVSNKDRYFYGQTDRIVLSGKNLKQVEGNFVRQRYEPLEEGYYTNIPDEELTVFDNSKQHVGVGDNFYGTQRLTPEEVMSQAEAEYAERSARYLDPSSSWVRPPKDPNFLTGKPKSGNPADGVYSAEESAETYTQILNDHNEDLRLFADPANKEEAIQKILGEARQGFANMRGPVDELELFGSGFDMKVVGKFRNKTGGYDYVVKPKNIKTLKRPNAELDATPLPSKLSDKPITYGESSDLLIGPDRMSGMKYVRIADEAEKQQLLNDFPEKITTVYREQWPSKGYQLADDFPMSRAGQQQALDESTDFALKWAFKDSDAFKETDKILGPAVKRLNELKGSNTTNGLYKSAVESLNRQLRSINAQDQDDAIKEFLKLNPDKTIADIGDHTSELVQILAKQNPNNGIMQRLLQTSESVLNMEKEAKQLNNVVKEQMKIVEANVDPKFKDKILKIYEDTMRDDPSRFDEIKTKFNDPYTSGINNNFTGLEEKIKLVHPAKHEPSFQSLSPFEKMYVGNNYENIGGVAMENSTITLGSKPNELSNQFMGVVIPEAETLETASNPKVIHFIEQYMKAPDRVAEINTHELGHNFQKFYGNWISRLQQNDPTFGYYVARQDPKSELLTMMKEVMVEPTAPTADAKMVTSMTDQTWLAAPNELHSDLMIARYNLAKQLMKTHGISMEEAIANIKAPENQDYYAEWLIKDPEVTPHFKPDAPNELKAGIIKYLPILIPAAGYGVMQGMNSETPKNKYGGNIKNLSKFIRK